MLAVALHAANINDTKAGIVAAKRVVEKYPSIQRFCADAGYRKTFVKKVQEILSLDIDISERIKHHKWQKLPWR